MAAGAAASCGDSPESAIESRCWDEDDAADDDDEARVEIFVPPASARRGITAAAATPGGAAAVASPAPPPPTKGKGRVDVWAPARAARASLLEKTDELELPPGGALDRIINALGGPDHVAEMTGTHIFSRLFGVTRRGIR